MVSLIFAGCSVENDKVETPDTTTGENTQVNTEENGGTDTGIGAPYRPQTQLAIGAKTPDFTLTNLDGDVVNLSDYRDSIVLINFWASWCHWCDVEMPDLNRLHNENEDVVVLAVNVEESQDVARNYIEENGLDFPVVLDSDGAISRQFLIDGLPNSYFVNPEGTFMGRVRGMITYDQMIEIITDIRNAE